MRKLESVSAPESNISMKKFRGFVRLNSSPFRQKWFKGGAILLAAVTLSAGCGKKSEPVASTNQSADQTNQTPDQTSQAAAQPVAAAAAPADAQPDLAVINRAVRRWLMANRRPPKDFADFAATAGVPIPPAPPGKKYILTHDMHVQLVNQ